MDVLIILVALGLLRWWASDRAADARARQEQCLHPPEQRRTIRVNAILTANPRFIDAVIPGRRWLVKQCDGCGKQWQLYAGTLQPWDEYLAEYEQETRDREAQFAARRARHEADLKHARTRRQSR